MASGVRFGLTLLWVFAMIILTRLLPFAGLVGLAALLRWVF